MTVDDGPILKHNFWRSTLKASLFYLIFDLPDPPSGFPFGSLFPFNLLQLPFCPAVLAPISSVLDPSCPLPFLFDIFSFSTAFGWSFTGDCIPRPLLRKVASCYSSFLYLFIFLFGTGLTAWSVYLTVLRNGSGAVRTRSLPSCSTTTLRVVFFLPH